MSNIFDGFGLGKLVASEPWTDEPAWRGICDDCGSSGGFLRGRLPSMLAVDRGYVSGIERRSFNPMIDVLDCLAVALCVDVAEFLVRLAEGGQAPAPLRPGRRRD